MTRPTLPAAGDSVQNGRPWQDTLNNGIWAVSDTADQALALAAANQSGGQFGVYALDSFTGASDDLKLTAALTFAKNEGTAGRGIPAIMMPTTRVPQFNTGGRVPFSGMKIIGGPGGNRNPELALGTYITSFVKLRCGNAASSWFVGTGSIYNVYIANIGFEGNNQVQFWDQNSSQGTLYSCRFESLGFNLFKHVFGRPAAACGLTQVEFVGHWTANNAWDQQFTLGGSDNQLWMEGYINVGTGQSNQLTRADGLGFYIQLSTLSNTQVGYIYASGLNGWNCLRVTGNSDGLDFFGGVYEGYKASGNILANDGVTVVGTLANPGNVVRLEGGCGNFFGGNFGQAMHRPPTGHSGVIQVTAGEWNFFGPNFYKGAMAESVPCISISAAARVTVISAHRRQNESWSARPGWKISTGVTGATFDLFPTSSMTAL